MRSILQASRPGLQIFQAAWTDNRDAHIGKASYETDGRLMYTKPILPPSPLPANWSVSDQQCPAGVDNTGTRDANVYTSRITQDFSLTVPGNSKPKTPGVVRAFAFQLANNLELTPGAATPETPTLFKTDDCSIPPHRLRRLRHSRATRLRRR